MVSMCTAARTLKHVSYLACHRSTTQLSVSAAASWCFNYALHRAGTVNILQCTLVNSGPPTHELGPLYSKHVSLACRSLRQKRSAILIFTENLVQCVNLTFYTMPNVYLIQRPCAITDPFLLWCAWVRWTCWNTVGFLLFIVICFLALEMYILCSSWCLMHRNSVQLHFKLKFKLHSCCCNCQGHLQQWRLYHSLQLSVHHCVASQ